MNPIRAGLGCLFSGAGWILRRPRLFAVGAVPPLITSVLMLGVFISMFFWVPGLVAALTGFSAGWADWLGALLRGFATVIVFLGIIMVMVVAFTSLTLLIGGPFYERIARAVEYELGGAPTGQAVEIGGLRSIAQSIAVIAVTLIAALVFFLLGLIPLVGALLSIVGLALVSGWLVTIELLAVPGSSRGAASLRARHRMLTQRRRLALGFAIPTGWLLSLPFVSVIAFPAAAAGAVVLTRKLSGEPTKLVRAEGTAA